MPRVLVLLALVLAAAGAWLLVSPGGGETKEEGIQREDPGDQLPPELRGAAGAVAQRRPEQPTETAGGTAAAPEKEVVFLSGIVLDAETGRPIEGARVHVERRAEPCPHLPGTIAGPQATSDGEGRFALKAPQGLAIPSGSLDLFASAVGHVTAVACAPPIPGETTLRLPKALQVRGHVKDPHARAVSGAVVRAVPAPDTPAVPGHASEGATDEHGDVLLDGLLPGDVRIEIDHPNYWPSKSGPYDPQRDSDISFVLTPALRAGFKVRSNDGRPVRNATLHWTTSGPTAKSELLLLSCSDLEVKGEQGSEVACVPIRVPCDASSVVFVVKADGYGAWTSPPESLPPEGGERTFDVVLSDDRNVGSIRVTLEDESGKVLKWSETRSVVTGVVSQGPPASAGYVVEGGDDLRFPAMPVGKYRLLLASPVYAPLAVDAEVVAGRTTELRATTRPPARVRVRFTAPERVVVLFRMTQGGKVVYAMPEQAQVAGTDDPSKEPVYSAGDQGLLLSGLSGGSYVVEVMSPDLTAPPTTVRLQEGQTEEVEIDVRRR